MARHAVDRVPLSQTLLGLHRLLRADLQVRECVLHPRWVDRDGRQVRKRLSQRQLRDIARTGLRASLTGTLVARSPAGSAQGSRGRSTQRCAGSGQAGSKKAAPPHPDTTVSVFSGRGRVNHGDFNNSVAPAPCSRFASEKVSSIRRPLSVLANLYASPRRRRGGGVLVLAGLLAGDVVLDEEQVVA